MKKYIIIAIMALTLFGCGHEKQILKDDKAALEAKVESLSKELESNQKASATLVQVMTLMDSIDMGRKMLRVSLENSNSEQQFLEQMKELKDYVQQTSGQIAILEKEVKDSKGAQNTYAKNLKTLKAEFEQQKSAIALLETKLNDEKGNNQKLVALNTLQSETILDKDEQIDAKTLELSLLEEQIKGLKDAFKISEADGYFTQGEAYALAAQRTKLAPAKKKAAYHQALDSYQKALDLGKVEAKPKIEMIAKKLK